MERTFFFLGFCPPGIRAVWRGFNMDSTKRKNNFSGEKGFSVLSRLLYRPQEVSGEECGRVLNFVFGRTAKHIQKYNFDYCYRLFPTHPTQAVNLHTPRNS